MNKSIKLLGISKKIDGRVFALVAPMMIDEGHPLFSVSDVFNAIMIRGNALGDVMFYGKGAGKLPTASAVVSDVVDAVRHMGVHIGVQWRREKLALAPYETYSSPVFVRVKGKPDEHLEKLRQLFGEVSICCPDGIEGEFGFVTPAMTVADFEEKRAKLSGFITRIFVNA